jgi:hypothetical protein
VQRLGNGAAPLVRTVLDAARSGLDTQRTARQRRIGLDLPFGGQARADQRQVIGMSRIMRSSSARASIATARPTRATSASPSSA